MSEHILNMVKMGNPEAIEKYVKNHLPNDQASLERIYKELLEYNNEPQSGRKLSEQKRSHSMNNISKKMSFSSLKNLKKEQSTQFKRTENLIKMLKEKGLKVTNDSQQKGMQLYTNHRKKIVKPLITNSKLLKSQEAQIDRLIHRYTINGDYYKEILANNKQKETNDPEMDHFFQRRNAILESLRNKTNLNANQNPKYDHVAKKIYNPENHRVSFEQIPHLKQSKIQSSRKTSTQNLLNICNTQVKSEKYKSVKPTLNHFQILQEKLQEKDQQQQWQLTYNEIANTIVKQLGKQQYQRYTNSYMSMLTDKTKAGSKCKLNMYHKDLIQDEKKMRKIIDFNSK